MLVQGVAHDITSIMNGLCYDGNLQSDLIAVIDQGVSLNVGIKIISTY